MRSAARSARARPLGASYGVAATCSSPAASALAFSNRAETTAQNAADVRDLLRARFSLTDAELDRVERHKLAGARATVEPKLVWLQSRLDLDDARLRKILLLLPRVLGFSVENNLAPTLDWLQTRLDLDESGLRKMVLALPSLLGCSVEDNLAPKLEWLRKRLELDDAGLRKMLLTHPRLLGYSVGENLAPKLEFIAREIGLSHAELREWVVKNPPCLSYSLANRYRPRLEACRAAGVDVKRVLSYATQTDETFCKCMGIEPEALVAARESVLSV